MIIIFYILLNLNFFLVKATWDDRADLQDKDLNTVNRFIALAHDNLKLQQQLNTRDLQDLKEDVNRKLAILESKEAWAAEVDQKFRKLDSQVTTLAHELANRQKHFQILVNEGIRQRSEFQREYSRNQEVYEKALFQRDQTIKELRDQLVTQENAFRADLQAINAVVQNLQSESP